MVLRKEKKSKLSIERGVRLLTPKVLNFEGPIFRKVARVRCFDGLLVRKTLFFVKISSENYRSEGPFEV